MLKFFKNLLSDSNTVNEQTFVGLVLLIATLCAGFIPAIVTEVFWGFLVATLACFKIKAKNSNLTTI